MSYNVGLGFNPIGVFSYGLQFTKLKHLNLSHVYPSFGVGTSIARSRICYLHSTSLTNLLLNGNKSMLLEINALLLTSKSLTYIEFDDNQPTFGPYLSQLGCPSNLLTVSGNRQSHFRSPMKYLLDVVLFH